jgi:hypothetical protein
MVTLRSTLRSVGALLGLTPPPRHAPAANVAKAEVALAEEDAGLTVEAILATGGTITEALGMAAQVHGAEAVLPLLRFHLERTRDGFLLGPMLNAVGEVDPLVAQRGLEAWGRNRHVPCSLDLSHCPWVTELPEGMRIDGDLNVGWTQVRTLPDGLEVGGSLYTIASKLARLPRGLTVGHSLYLPHDPAYDDPRLERVPVGPRPRVPSTWDGVIPDDLRVGEKMYAIPGGIGETLKSWRRRHAD